MAAPNIHPIAPGSLARVSIVVSAANANRDGTTGSYANVVATAGANGGVVPEVRAQWAGAVSVASTAMVLRLWHRVAGSGNYFMIDEVALALGTPTSAAVGPSAVFNRTNIPLGPNDTLSVTQTVAEAVHYSASTGSY